MIRSLKRRFLLIAMSSVIAVIAVLMLVLNITSYRSVIDSSDALLTLLADNGGSFPFHNIDAEPFPIFSPDDAQQQNKNPVGSFDFRNDSRFTIETPYETRYFSIAFDSSGTLIYSDTASIAAVSDSEAEELAENVIASGKAKGFFGDYRYIVSSGDENTLVVFLDCSRDLSTFRTFLKTSILVAVIGTVCVFLLLLLFSSVILRPIAESYARQKRFITDASHELKTPLTIIDANTEILEMTDGENEWTESIHHQTERLRAMTENLVALSRMEEENRKVPMVDFSLSDAVTESALPFETAAAAKGLSLLIQSEENLTMNGEEGSIRKLVSILLDNALKYTDEGGCIRLTLQKKSRTAELSVSNPSSAMKKGDHRDLLDRFSRADASRSSETGGFGIGLSMAKAIVEEHHGKITVKSPEDGTFTITISLPQA